jgi:hypothetical protein
MSTKATTGARRTAPLDQKSKKAVTKPVSKTATKTTA